MSEFDYAVRKLKPTDEPTVFYSSLPALEAAGLGSLSRLPFCIRILLESVLRMQGLHPAYEASHVVGLAGWTPKDEAKKEYPFLPARILLQDFTGVPCVADLAALRDAVQRAGKDPARVEPQIPVDLVIDHSVQIDVSGSADALEQNIRMEFARNKARYEFLRWGQGAFHNLRIIPPGLGICHQVNLEYLAKGVIVREQNGKRMAFPDTLVGTDSHTTMINGLGVLGWGVGGIEAEAAMLGQPIPVLTPVVTGVRLTGELQPGVTATDLTLHLTQMLRQHNVVEQFVEYFGPGLDVLSLADRATVANMAPEYGATMGFFPVDAETLRYLRETGRTDNEVDLVERYLKEQGLFRTPDSPDPVYNRVLELDITTVESSVAGPKKPHDRLALRSVGTAFQKALSAPVNEGGYGLSPDERNVSVEAADHTESLAHGSVLIASITSCTNTSNPHVMLAAGLMAKKALEKGLRVSSRVKTTLAPGSRVVTAYLKDSGLLPSFEQLGFHVAAYGCATCIGNSGPLSVTVEKAVLENKLVAAAVLSGNRNFEGRVHALTRANYLCSPPLVVAYALAGTVNIDLTHDSIGTDKDGNPVYLKDIWPTDQEILEAAKSAANPELYRALYNNVTQSNPVWNKLEAQSAPVYAWDKDCLYIREPPFVYDCPAEPATLADITDARVLGVFGDFITTDHISPAGSIPKDSPAGHYLMEHGISPSDFNSYGSRRGNHEVMMRGTFANIRIRNRMVDREGGWTLHVPTNSVMPIYDAAMHYAKEATPLVVLAGKLYGAGSSRDWAAKGPFLLGVKAVIAESFERIHRSNLVEMGVLPLQFMDGATAASIGLTGHERISVQGIRESFAPRKVLDVIAEGPDKKRSEFRVSCRVDSDIELEYYRHGGILPYVLRQAIQE